ncbi:MAG: GNAT family N-acetyltransferase [Hyphomicrobium sp.]
MLAAIVIRRLEDVADAAALVPGIDAIFSQSSNTQSFADVEGKQAFRERWLGRYLRQDRRWAYVALSADNCVAGYLVASLDDPAVTPRFGDISYFADFRDLTRQFPAHLHINLAPGFRGQGIGAALIARFAADAAAAGAPGVHVVTSRGARNVGFYEQNGFVERGMRGEGSGEIVFLGRALA